MGPRMTNGLWLATVGLLAANLSVALRTPSAAAAPDEPTHEVLRAKLIELVADDGRVVAQLHTAEDGSANLRLRDGAGEVRVKLGAAADGAALILMNASTEPGVWLESKAGASSIAVVANDGEPPRRIAP